MNMVFWKKNKNANKVTKHEFKYVTERIKSHFLGVKDMQIHLLDKVSRIHSDHNELSYSVKSDRHFISRWLEYFSRMHNSHSEDINTLKKTVLQLNEQMREMKKTNQNLLTHIENTKKNVVSDTEKQIKLLKEAVINVNNDYNVNNATQNNVNNDINALTRSEAKILGRLFEASTPLSYQDISSSTGHSPNTIKVYINSLKKKGIGFEEINAPNGTKLYAVPNKNKVKKLYNF